MTQFKKPMLSKIHIAKKQLGLDDDTYRTILMNVTGKTSCADMSERELNDVLLYFKSKGFKATKPKFGVRPSPRDDIQALMSKVEALLADSQLPWSYADAIAKQMFRVDIVQWLSRDQLWRLVVAMQAQANRKKESSK